MKQNTMKHQIDFDREISDSFWAFIVSVLRKTQFPDMTTIHAEAIDLRDTLLMGGEL